MATPTTPATVIVPPSVIVILWAAAHSLGGTWCYQLCEDEALADYRDYCMFVRIVDGISRRQSTNQDLDLIYECDACLANIRRTRSQPPEESQSLEARHELLLRKLMFPPNPLSSAQRDALYSNQHGNGNTILDEDEIFVIDL